MIGLMLTIKTRKIGLRKIHRVQLDPLMASVKKIMGSRDQGLIVMVRG